MATFDLVINTILNIVQIFLQVLTGDWDGALESLKRIAIDAWEFIQIFFTQALEGILNTLGLTLEGATTAWKNTWTNLGTILGKLMERMATTIIQFILIVRTVFLVIKTIVEEALRRLVTIIVTFISETITTWRENWELFVTIITEVWEKLKTVIKTKADELFAIIAGVILTGIIAWIDAWDEFKTIAVNIWESIKDAVKEKIDGFILIVTGGVRDAIDKAKKLLGIGSPSKVFASIGQDITKGLIQGVASMTPALQMTLGSQLSMAAAPMSAPSIVRNNSVQIGPNNINNGMDMALFTQMTEQTMVGLI